MSSLWLQPSWNAHGSNGSAEVEPTARHRHSASLHTVVPVLLTLHTSFLAGAIAANATLTMVYLSLHPAPQASHQLYFYEDEHQFALLYKSALEASYRADRKPLLFDQLIPFHDPESA